LAAIVILATVAPSHADDEIALPPNESLAGMTQAEWSQAWRQWAGSFEHHSPVADRTGDLCYAADCASFIETAARVTEAVDFFSSSSRVGASTTSSRIATQPAVSI
jgi:hypothetical protein